jgi:hypothetical protein
MIGANRRTRVAILGGLDRIGGVVCVAGSISGVLFAMLPLGRIAASSGLHLIRASKILSQDSRDGA